MLAFCKLSCMNTRENYGTAGKNEADLQVLTWEDVRDKLLKGKKHAEELSRQ